MTRAALPGTGVRGQSVEAGDWLYKLVQLIDTAQCVAFCLAQNPVMFCRLPLQNANLGALQWT